MNKLEALSQMNWSKRDVPADVVAPGSLVFNKVHTTVDPQAFALGKDLSVSDNPLAATTSVLKSKHPYTTTVGDQDGFKATVSYYSQRLQSRTQGRTSPTAARKAEVGDLKTEFTKIANQLNLDGKAVYANALA